LDEGEYSMIFNYQEFCWTKVCVRTFYNAKVCVDEGREGSRMVRIGVLVLVTAVIVFLIARLFAGAQSPVPKTGTAAPDFSLPSQESASVSLKDYRGSWVVLYFYPKDQTPGCTREAHNFQADQAKYAARHAVVLGVSVDSVDSHRKFCAKEGLNFKLLADTDGKVSKAYGSLTNLVVTKIAKRNTFLIDPAGKVARAYVSVDPVRHSEEVLAGLDEMQKTGTGVRVN
jgi:peroxiredoxin Q/BCP